MMRSGAGSGGREPPTLQDICADLIIQSMASRSDASAMDVYSFAKAFGIRRLYEHSRAYIRDRYAFYLERYGDCLPSHLDEDYAPLQRMHEERLKAEAFLSRRGSVVDRVKVELDQGGGAEQGFYPLRALVAGVEWPVGVDPAQREQFLSPEEFEAVFRVSKEHFNTLDRHSRLRMKKEHNLF